MLEWDKCRSLLLALSSEVLFDTLSMNYYLELIGSAIKVTNVKVLINESDRNMQGRFLIMLRNNGLYKFLNCKGDGNNIEIILASFKGKWIRDYGPVIAYNDQMELCLLDAIYYERNAYSITNTTSIWDDLSSYNRVPIETNPGNARGFDDAVSIYLSSYYNASHDNPAKLVIVPLQLWGGDYQCDSKGNVFTSSNTLLMNGGIKDEVDSIFKSYYGAKTVTYLHPLPGPTIKHIDMFLKLVNDSTMILGKYLESFIPDDRDSLNAIYLENVQADVNRLLDLDSVLIKKKFPYMKIIRIPMPQLKIENEVVERAKKRLSELQNRLKQARELESDTLSKEIAKIKQRLDSAYEHILDSTINRDSVWAVITRLYGMEDSLKTGTDYNSIFDTDTTDLHLLIEKEINKLKIYNKPQYNRYIYRTYLNSTYINGYTGKIVLVPRYKEFKHLEDNIVQAYRTVYPDADVIFIDSDAIISSYGAVHCTTLTLPR
jgi:agmatine/peptidylarginine deiminase